MSEQAPFIPVTPTSRRCRRRGRYCACRFSGCGGAGHLEPRRLGRARRDPRDRGACRLGDRGRSRDDRADAARVLARARRRRARRPLEPQGRDGDVRHRTRGAARLAAVRRQPARSRHHLVLHRGAHTAVGAGEGRVGAEHRRDPSSSRRRTRCRSSRRTARSRSARSCSRPRGRCQVARRLRRPRRSASTTGIARDLGRRLTFLVVGAPDPGLTLPKHASRDRAARSRRRSATSSTACASSVGPARARRDDRPRGRAHRWRCGDPLGAVFAEDGARRRKRQLRSPHDGARRRRRDRGRHAARVPAPAQAPHETVFTSAVIATGVSIIAVASVSTLTPALLARGGIGATRRLRLRTGFTLLQENVTDEMRGRTFATLYTVVRLCLLLSFTSARSSRRARCDLRRLVDGDDRHRSVTISLARRAARALARRRRHDLAGPRGAPSDAHASSTGSVTTIASGTA